MRASRPLLCLLLGLVGCRPMPEARQRALSREPAPTAFLEPRPAPVVSEAASLDAAPTPTAAPTVRLAGAARPSRCNQQRPHDFLVRSNYVWDAKLPPEARAARKALHHRALEYRTREYGHIEGFGDPGWNRLEPKHYAKTGKFMGVGVKMNVRVLAALGCVEEDIVAECGDTPYAPRMLDTLRTKNTFHDDEVSNHLYGIAIDIDPDRNSCCGCVTPGAHWSKCDVEGLTAYERTALPRCWIDAFERYGFYWLGHDPQLEDTMHFEFLGDPDRIVRGDAPMGSG